MTKEDTESLKKILAPLPSHVGIIMDGNGRWARSRGLKRSFGHRAGTERLRGLIRLSSDLGIEALSLYAFSTENWARPKKEVDTLFSLFMEFFVSEVDELHRNNVRITAMGDISGLPENVRRACVSAIERTRDNTGLKLNIALNYGSLAEIGHAARLIAEDVACGRLEASDVDEKAVLDRLYVSDIPPLDLLIRTGGEKRLSNFMLIQLYYAELLFVDDYFPDFSDERYIDALREFTHRKRRFGRVEEDDA